MDKLVTSNRLIDTTGYTHERYRQRERDKIHTFYKVASRGNCSIKG